MKLAAINPGNTHGPVAFTLPEVMVTMAILGVAMAGFLMLHLFSIKMNHITSVKLGASDQARDVISKLIHDIRECGDVKVGTGGLNGFTEPGTNQLMQGNALMIYPVKTNTNVWIRYYWDPADTKVKRVTSDDLTPRTLVEGITNQYVFTLESFDGQILTNSNNKRVVGVTLQFYKLTLPSAAIGKPGLFDFYQVRTKIARRTIE